MINFRRVCCALVLATAFALSALAGETNSPPCAPGETSSPPCLEMNAGETNGPPSANGITHGRGVSKLGDIAAPGLMAFISLLPGLP